MSSLQGKRVLITGAAGFVGGNLARHLLQHGAVVHAMVRATSNLWRIAEIAGELTLHRMDLTEGHKLRQLVGAIGPDFVFHLARYGGSYPEGNHAAILRTNVLGTANLLAAADAVDYKRFVHFGSSMEYGPRNRPIDETEPLEPVTWFGACKAAATVLCRQHAREHNRPIVVLRPFSIYGYWENPAHLIPTAISAAFDGTPVRLTPPGYRRDLIFVEDVIEACLLSLDAEAAAGEVINIASGRQWSNEEVIGTVQDVLGCQIDVTRDTYPPRPFDTPCWLADIRKAMRVLGWQPRHSLRSGLEKTVGWISRQRGIHEDSPLYR